VIKDGGQPVIQHTKLVQLINFYIPQYFYIYTHIKREPPSMSIQECGVIKDDLY